jgi:hypothetical protein
MTAGSHPLANGEARQLRLTQPDHGRTALDAWHLNQNYRQFPASQYAEAIGLSTMC